MQEYSMAIVRIDSEPVRLVHKRECRKLDNVNMPYDLGSHETMNRALEKAKLTFNMVELCPVCCKKGKF